jgi:hypothetical protein
VLAAPGRQVEARGVKLDPMVKEREDLKSFPSGVAHLKRVRTTITVDVLAP